MFDSAVTIKPQYMANVRDRTEGALPTDLSLADTPEPDCISTTGGRVTAKRQRLGMRRLPSSRLPSKSIAGKMAALFAVLVCLSWLWSPALMAQTLQPNRSAFSAGPLGSSLAEVTAGASNPAPPAAPPSPSAAFAAAAAGDQTAVTKADPVPATVALPPLATTQFSDFVHETTGRSVPLFGYNLFGTSSFPALHDIPVPADYVLGPGDDIKIKIWGSLDASLALTIDRNGQINIPKSGPLTVAGNRADRLEPLLKSHLGRVYNNFQLSATLGRLRSIQVFVVGQARKPGVYTVSSLSTLISALFESGGPTASGSMRQIRLMRAGKAFAMLDLYKFIMKGDTSADMRLLSGDVIVIPPAGPRVALLGALDNPAIYELTDSSETIESLLDYSGRQHVLASPHKVLVERINPFKGKAPRQVEERSLNAEGLASTVRNGDVVTLFKISPEFGNAVTLRGNVAAPLRYAFRPGMKVSDLIPEVGALIQPDYYTRKNIMVQHESGRAISGERVISEVQNLVDEINWDYAAIERLDPKEIRTQLIPFNLGKAIKEHDPQHDLNLQPGDVVTVFNIRDLPVSLDRRTQFVRIGGEVMVPGVYQIQPGETLAQLIRRVGGFSSHAFPYGMVFTRESTRVQQQDNLNKSIRRLETEINAQIASNLQNVTDGDKGSNVQAQIAGQKILLERLKGFKASGRIALELDSKNPLPPNIVMEDGDQLIVPHRPSFVGVFGEVLADSSFIHSPGLTVSDYLTKAGLTRDADLDNIMLVRADGTAETSQRRTIFKASLTSKQLYPGDSIFVPGVIDRRTAYSQFIQGAKDWTSILSQFGLGVAALKTIGSIR